MVSNRETSGVTERATPPRRAGGESPTAPTATAWPGGGSRLATGDLPVAELGGGALIGAVVGRLIGGGRRGAALGAAAGAAVGTALGLVTGGLLGGGSPATERTRREPAFGPRVDPQKRTAPVSPAGPPRAAEERGESEPAAAEAATGGAAESAAETAETAPESLAEEPPKSGTEGEGASAASTGEETSSEAPDYGSWTKAELYEEAKRREIEGRSTMTKAELVAALRRATFHT